MAGRKNNLNDHDWRRHKLINPSTVQEITAGENISIHQVIMVVGSQAFKYDPSNVANYNKAVGVACTSATMGQPVQYAYEGEMDVIFTAVDGDIYYSDNSGNLTTTPNSSGVFQEIAVGIDTDRIFIDLKDPICV